MHPSSAGMVGGEGVPARGTCPHCEWCCQGLLMPSTAVWGRRHGDTSSPSQGTRSQGTKTLFMEVLL